VRASMLLEIEQGHSALSHGVSMPTRAEQHRAREERRRAVRKRAEHATPGIIKAEETRRRKAAERAQAGSERAREHEAGVAPGGPH